MRHAISLGLITLVLISFTEHELEPETVPRDAYPDATVFFRNIEHYPYVASAERTARITAGIHALRRCMTKDEVRARLGAPDYSEIMDGPKGPNMHWNGSYWTYFLSIKDDMSNMKNPRVEAFFDKHGRAKWIVPTGIEGAVEIGAPHAVCGRTEST